MTQQQQQQQLLQQQQQQLPQLQLQLRQPADGTGVHFLAFILRCLALLFISTADLGVLISYACQLRYPAMQWKILRIVKRII